MIIRLTSGEMLLPKGDVTVEDYGVKIHDFNNWTIIPHTQVKWIFQGADYQEEFKTYTKMKSRRKANPIVEIDRLSSGELMKGMYGI